MNWRKGCSMWLLLAAAAILLGGATSQCPWQRDIPDLQSACLCAYNLGQELSVQCDMVEFPKLVIALDKYARSVTVDLLYVNNSTVGVLKDRVFAALKINNVQMSGCSIRELQPEAFAGQEQTLKNLNLQDNDLTVVPVEGLRNLKALSLLDLSHNRITSIPDGAFETLGKLATLKLSDNNATLSSGSFRGLERSLKNLNLKGTRQKEVPEAIRGLKSLAFLDLSQNSLREIPGSGALSGLDALTALNLERNLLQALDEDAFVGVRKTLSSLSLLNNLIPDFPKAALGTLNELRVLDIGFNLLTELPTDSFKKNPLITLLALDGNPLSTIPFAALSHLNNTLRGLSLGGRFLHCDCRLRWVVDWIRQGDLQVTSRERNPQFCGSPPRFRERGFYTIQPEELTCTSEMVGVATVVNEEEDLLAGEGSAVATRSTPTTTEPTTTPVATTTTTTTTTTTKRPATTTTSTTLSTTSTSAATTRTTRAPSLSRNTVPSWKSHSQQHKPSLVMGYPSKRPADDANEVIVKNAFRQDSSVIIQWGSQTSNILGFRVVYRLFGDKSFKQGPPLEATEREFKIKNVPSQECIVVCVVSLEDINISPDTVPYSQCREVRTVSSPVSNMDKITIAASAAICGTIVVAVLVFVAASRRRGRKLHQLAERKGLGGKGALSPITGLPVNCCAGSPGGPLSSLATLNAFSTHKDWDQVSAYSTHSVGRPRLFDQHQPNSLQDDARSHFSSKAVGRTRSLADGQSQHSFSGHSGRYLAAFPSNLVASRTDLRQSRQSLAMQSDRLSRMSQQPQPSNGHHHQHQHHHVHSSVAGSGRRNRPRSRSRPSSRYGSTHTLNNYGDTSDNWTDHDMDIYMARNPTTRGGLVPL